jgi:phage/plasmid-associated DNA primase
VKVQSKLQTSTGITNAEAKSKQITSVLAKLETDAFKSSVLRECESFLKRPKFHELLNKDRHLIGFDNGVFDVKTDCFRKYSHEDW